MSESALPGWSLRLEMGLTRAGVGAGVGVGVHMAETSLGPRVGRAASRLKAGAGMMVPAPQVLDGEGVNLSEASLDGGTALSWGLEAAVS